MFSGQATYFYVCLCTCVCADDVSASAAAVCLFGGRELVEGDQKAVRDSSGRCLLFECRVSRVNTHIHSHILRESKKHT